MALSSTTLFALLYFAYSSDAVSEGTLRFVQNGIPTTNQAWSAGIVEVYWGGRWGNICYGSSFGVSEADVICRQLAYNGHSSYTIAKNSTYGTDVVSTVLKDVSCGSKDLTLAQCSFIQSTDSSCSDNNDVVVTCKSTRIWDSPTIGDIRLTGGSYSNEGLLEVYCNGLWGTVCDTTFTGTTATVACRQLGYNSYHDYDHLALTGKFTQRIWLDYLNSGGCSSSSSCLSTCQSCPSDEVTGCVHSQDVTLECEYDSSRSQVYTDTSDSCENVAALAAAAVIAGVIGSLFCCCFCILIITVPLCICKYLGGGAFKHQRLLFM